MGSPRSRIVGTGREDDVPVVCSVFIIMNPFTLPINKVTVIPGGFFCPSYPAQTGYLIVKEQVFIIRRFPPS